MLQDLRVNYTHQNGQAQAKSAPGMGVGERRIVMETSA